MHEECRVVILVKQQLLPLLSDCFMFSIYIFMCTACCDGSSVFLLSNFFHLSLLPVSGMWLDLHSLFLQRAAMHCIANAVIAKAMPSVRPSVCPSVTRRYCVQTNQPTANILIPYERAFNKVFLRYKKIP